MARKAVKALMAHGSGELLVVNRSWDAASELAREWSGEARTFEQLPVVLARADIVISSTSAPHPIIHAAQVRQAMANRERPLVFIDIAVPRDVDPLVREIPGVHLFDLDDLQARLDCSLAERRKEVPRAEAIVAEEVQRFQERQAGVHVLPIVKALRRKAETLRTRELARVLGQLPGADAALRRRLDHFSQTLVNQLLHQPTQRLRAEAGNGQAAEYARIAGELFGLEEAGPAEERRSVSDP
jgi:glutamyl-tRNA reductase